MQFCLTHLKWSPRTMWGATPRELAAALARADGPGAGPDRERLAALLRRYPD